jgi:hypothetical protein
MTMLADIAALKTRCTKLESSVSSLSRRITVLERVNANAGIRNVKNYGATGNGTTDDTTAIRSAITAAAAGGGVVYFPAGTYLVQPLTIPPGVVLQGVNGQGYLGPVETIPNLGTLSRIKLKAGSTAPLLSPDDSGVNLATHVRIRDLCLDPNNVPQRTLDLPDQTTYPGRFWLLERCYFVHSGFSSASRGSAVYVGNENSGVAMRDCVVFAGTGGYATRSGWNGVTWYGSDGYMENCYVGYFSNCGLECLGGDSIETFTMVGGGVFTCEYGVVVGGKGFNFHGVSIDHHFDAGTYIGYGPTLFSGCTFHSNSQNGSGASSDIRIGGSHVNLSVMGCSFPACGTKPAYGIRDEGTGNVVHSLANMVEQTYAIAFTNVATSECEQIH